MNTDFNFDELEAQSEYESERYHDALDAQREIYESEGWDEDEYPFKDWLDDGKYYESDLQMYGYAG